MNKTFELCNEQNCGNAALERSIRYFRENDPWPEHSETGFSGCY